MELYFDIDLCIGCKSCEIACTIENGRKMIAVDVFDSQFPITSMCRHCKNSPCVEVCPEDAIKKVDSVVHVNENLCIGCRSCSIVCPFGNLEFEELRHVSTKCDLCLSRLKDGEKPVCVLTCPTGALRYCDVAEMEEIAKKGSRRREMIGARMYAWRPR